MIIGIAIGGKSESNSGGNNKDIFKEKIRASKISEKRLKNTEKAQQLLKQASKLQAESATISERTKIMGDKILVYASKISN